MIFFKCHTSVQVKAQCKEYESQLVDEVCILHDPSKLDLLRLTDASDKQLTLRERA